MSSRLSGLLLNISLVAAADVSADGGQSSQSASPDDVRRPRLLRAGWHIVVVRTQRVSSDEVRQR